MIGAPPNKALQLTSVEPIGRSQLNAVFGRRCGARAPDGMRIIPNVKADEVRLGWSTAPRTALWLCLPALLTGLAGVVILSIGVLLPDNSALRRPIQEAAAAEGVVFALPSVLLTPIAAMVTTVITWRKRWSSRVTWTLWLIVAISLAAIVPATNLAMASYVFSTPRPAEAPLGRK